MLFNYDELGVAVFFYSAEGDIIRQMHLSEFEAVLDGYVPLIDLANREVLAVYTEINNQYLVCRTVFFRLPITSSGFVEGSWVLPLMNMAAIAEAGPDLGAGPIRMACYSKCPVPRFKEFLWDPQLQGAQVHLHNLAKTVKQNRLSIQFRSFGELTSESKGFTHPGQAGELELQLNKQIQQLQVEHKNQLQFLEKSKALDAQSRQLELEKRSASLQQQLSEKQTIIEGLQQELGRFQEKADNLEDKVAGLRDYYEHKVHDIEGRESTELNDLKRLYESQLAESQALAKEQEALAKEHIKARDVELMYRGEQEQQFREEILRLREQLHEASNSNVEREALLQEMAEKDVTLVTFQPGCGHLTLPRDRVLAFLRDPVAYIAQYCQVSVAHYNAWLGHYHMPVCKHVLANGDTCGESLPRVELPQNFKPEHSDRCDKHHVNNVTHLRLAGE